MTDPLDTEEAKRLLSNLYTSHDAWVRCLKDRRTASEGKMSGDVGELMHLFGVMMHYAEQDWMSACEELGKFLCNHREEGR